MADFQWKTEDEDSWVSDSDPALPAPAPRRFLLVGLLFLAVLLSLALVAAYRQVDRRVDGVAADVEAEISNNQALVELAAAEGDVELLVSVLSGRDQQWAVVQQQLVHQGALFDRRALGLHWLPDEQTSLQLTLSPDLQQADLLTNRAYTVQVGSEVTAVVWLQQTALYRKGVDRWLYAPPDELYDFWGAQQAVQGRYLALTFPERDQQVVRRLAADLEALLGEMWAMVGSEALPLYVRFETDPEALLQLSSPQTMMVPGQDLTLPAPTLVGIPTDEAAYRALFRGYASQVVARALLTLSGYHCCEHLVFYQGLLDWVLINLGLQPPVAPTELARVQAQSLSLDTLQSISATSGEQELADEQRQAVVTFAAFLLQSRSLAALLENPRLSADNVAAWFPGQTSDQVQQAWWDFLADSSI